MKATSPLGRRAITAHALATPVNGLSHDWAAIWLTPALGAVGGLIVFLIFFRAPQSAK